jgi:hypothetical protein
MIDAENGFDINGLATTGEQRIRQGGPNGPLYGSRKMARVPIIVNR